jgi:hypothetical protein
MHVLEQNDLKPVVKKNSTNCVAALSAFMQIDLLD